MVNLDSDNFRETDTALQKVLYSVAVTRSLDVCLRVPGI